MLFVGVFVWYFDDGGCDWFGVGVVVGVLFVVW